MPKIISFLKIWIMAARPKTLAAAISPVLIGTAMAFGDGIHHFPTALRCFWAALCIQIGTNLANDYFDFKKGADRPTRQGPTRVTQAGLLKPATVLTASLVVFTIAAFISLELIERGALPILIIGILSIASGILYTAGRFSLAFLGLGDIFAFIFFGPVAVAGTYYVQSFEMNAAVIWAGAACGLFSVAILTVNNLRDIEDDRLSGKKTLAVRFGKSFAQNEYLVSVLTASLIPVLIFGLIQDHPGILMTVVICLLAIPGFKAVLTKSDGPSLNLALAFTGELLLIFSILFSIGWIL